MFPILDGFAVAFDPMNLLYVFIGVLVGTIIGLLPGLGPSATIAMLLPLTYTLEPTTAIIMLAGIYYGSMYGGTITSVLLRLPGEAASVVTTFDGYQMARQGRAGAALGISAIGSFIGGTIAVIGLTLFAPLLARVALNFGPVEFTAIAVLGILLVNYLSTTSFSRALLMAAVGLLLATIGQDPITGQQRFTGGIVEMFSGLDIVVVAMGVFGVGEIIHNIAHPTNIGRESAPVGRVWPTRGDLKRSAGPIARGSILGFAIGILPGGGGLMSSLASYATEKRLSKTPERFGRGAIEGVAGPETANNASSTSAFVPLLTLGLPSNAVLALIFGALLIQGVTPGPTLIDKHPEVFWGVIASMYIGNIFLLVLNLPLVGAFIRVLRIPPRVLAGGALALTLIGAYTISFRQFDMWLVLALGIFGYLLRRWGFDAAPLVLAFVLGDILESSLRRSLLLSGGSPAIFVTEPISAVILGVCALLLLSTVLRARRLRSIARNARNVIAKSDSPAGAMEGDESK